MAFEFGDQPNYYTTALMPRYWDLCSSGMEVASGDGFDGANGWTASGADEFAVQYPRSVDTGAFGFVMRLYIDSLPGAAAILLGAAEAPDPGSPTTPRLQVCCVLNTDGTVSIYRGDSGGTLLATSADTVPTGDHVRIAFAGTIAPVNGSAAVYLGVDGGSDETLQLLVQAAGVSTDDVGTGRRRGVYMGGTPDLVTSYLYTQGGGTLPQNPLCDVQFPDADTSLNDWGAEPGGSSNASEINETAADDDTSFVYASTVNDSFAVEHETQDAKAQILGVRVVATVANEEASPSYAYRPLIRSAGGGVSLGVAKTVTDSWIGVDLNAPVNPFGGLPWTAAAINGSGFGGRTTL